jgi:hypothetical protein
MLTYILAFISGFLVKAVDWIEDDLKKPLKMRWLFAIMAGVFIGYIISASTFASIFLAALFAQVFARKVDKASHAATVLAAAVVFIFLGVNPAFDAVYFLIFLIPAFLDELEFTGKWAFITEYRLFLGVVAALFGIFIGRWDFLMGILGFDIGYLGFKIVGESVTKNKGAPVEQKTLEQSQKKSVAAPKPISKKSRGKARKRK